MNQGFWKKLKKPIIVLAPMADVTDAAFRRIIAKYGKPDLMYTEFTSADGLMLADEKGKTRLMKDLIFTESERPIVAQFFSSRPENMEGAARLAASLGFDGIDINMGCPDKSIERQGAGAAHMKNPENAREVIRAAKRGAGILPVSVKTRIGYNKNELATWLPILLAEEPGAITIHARTRKEMSKVPARWEHVAEAVKIRDQVQKALPPEERTLILGNGDIRNVAHAREQVAACGADGAMLGRAIFGNPFLFSNKAVTLKEKLAVLIEHTILFEELFHDVKNFAVMKKHYKSYLAGFDNTKELRMQLMETKNAGEVERIITEYLNHSVIPAKAGEKRQQEASQDFARSIPRDPQSGQFL